MTEMPRPEMKNNAAWWGRLKAVPGVNAGRAWVTGSVEQRLRIVTECPADLHPDGTLSTRFRDAIGYVPLDYAVLWWCMRPLRLRPEDVLFDIGCGMGRVLCTFARRRLKRCIGIEYSAELGHVAMANAKSLRGRKTPIEVRIGDAADADYSGGTVFWMFNPFGARTLQRVIERIQQSVIESPRPIQIVYVKPEHEDVLSSSAWLCRTSVRTVPITWIGRATYWRNLVSG